MSSLLVFLHVAAAILFIGPVMYAVSVFPGAALKAADGDTGSGGIARGTHRITQIYGYLSLLVPLFGVTLMFSDWSRYGSYWPFHVAIALSVIAWVILLGFVLPKQQKVAGAIGLLPPGEEAPEDKQVDVPKAKSQLAILGGIFNVLWIATLVLMYI